jgi:hypothetical protein
MSELDQQKEQRKKRVKEKVDNVAKTLHEIKLRNKQETISFRQAIETES